MALSGAGAAGLLTDPQTAGVVSFLQIQPVYVFFKQNKNTKKKYWTFLYSFSQLFSHGFPDHFFFITYNTFEIFEPNLQVLDGIEENWKIRQDDWFGPQNPPKNVDI